VLYVDGEMPLTAVRDRLAAIVGGVDAKPPSPDHFVLLAADYHRDGLPNIGDDEGQERLLPHLAGVELVIFDNLSTLASGIRENEADDWAPIQRFILRLRRRGIGVLLIHHAGRNGQARGTSKREDILDTVIALRRPDDYDPAHGASFEIHFEKSRGFWGPDAEPFEASLDVTNGVARWGIGEIACGRKNEALVMFAAGDKVPAVVAALNVPRATVYRWHTQWKAGNGGGSR
jgi:putative DNA primase/helicase